MDIIKTSILVKIGGSEWITVSVPVDKELYVRVNASTNNSIKHAYNDLRLAKIDKLPEKNISRFETIYKRYLGYNKKTFFEMLNPPLQKAFANSGIEKILYTSSNGALGEGEYKHILECIIDNKKEASNENEE